MLQKLLSLLLVLDNPPLQSGTACLIVFATLPTLLFLNVRLRHNYLTLHSSPSLRYIWHVKYSIYLLTWAILHNACSEADVQRSGNCCRSVMGSVRESWELTVYEIMMLSILLNNLETWNTWWEWCKIVHFWDVAIVKNMLNHSTEEK
jgi:hypothetical protein